jgi:hypothetical protein
MWLAGMTDILRERMFCVHLTTLQNSVKVLPTVLDLYHPGYQSLEIHILAIREASD